MNCKLFCLFYASAIVNAFNLRIIGFVKRHRWQIVIVRSCFALNGQRRAAVKGQSVSFVVIGLERCNKDCERNICASRESRRTNDESIDRLRSIYGQGIAKFQPPTAFSTKLPQNEISDENFFDSIATQFCVKWNWVEKCKLLEDVRFVFQFSITTLKTSRKIIQHSVLRHSCSTSYQLDNRCCLNIWGGILKTFLHVFIALKAKRDWILQSRWRIVWDDSESNSAWWPSQWHENCTNISSKIFKFCQVDHRFFLLIS